MVRIPRNYFIASLTAGLAFATVSGCSMSSDGSDGVTAAGGEKVATSHSALSMSDCETGGESWFCNAMSWYFTCANGASGDVSGIGYGLSSYEACSNAKIALKVNAQIVGCHGTSIPITKNPKEIHHLYDNNCSILVDGSGWSQLNGGTWVTPGPMFPLRATLGVYPASVNAGPTAANGASLGDPDGSGVSELDITYDADNSDTLTLDDPAPSDPPPPPPSNACNPGDKYCVDGDVFAQCNSDGQTYTNYSCSASWPGTTCSGGYCVGPPPPPDCGGCSCGQWDSCGNYCGDCPPSCSPNCADSNYTGSCSDENGCGADCSSCTDNWDGTCSC
jgi:hypothetical protein